MKESVALAPLPMAVALVLDAVALVPNAIVFSLLAVAPLPIAVAELSDAAAFLPIAERIPQ